MRSRSGVPWNRLITRVVVRCFPRATPCTRKFWSEKICRVRAIWSCNISLHESAWACLLATIAEIMALRAHLFIKTQSCVPSSP